MSKSVATTYRPDVAALQKQVLDICTQAFWKPIVGENAIRVLPGWNLAADPNAPFWYDQVLHYGFKVKEEDRERTVTVPCGVYSPGGSGTCPVCELVSHIMSQRGNKDPLVQELRPVHNVYMQILDRTMKVPVIQIWRTNKKNRDTILKWLAKKPDLLDPEHGRDFVLERTGEGKFTTRYTLEKADDESLIALPGWQDKLYKLDEFIESFVEYRDEEQILQLMEDNYGDQFNLSEILGGNNEPPF